MAGAANPSPDITDAENQVYAVEKRIACKPPDPDQGELEAIEIFARNWCAVHLVPLDDSTDLSFGTWLDGTNYSTSRKRHLTKINERIDVSSINDPVVNRELSSVKCFLKDETYPEFKHPRGIFSRSDAFKGLFGPLCKAIETELYKQPEFIKHVPVESRGKYIEEFLRDDSCDYWTSDYTAYESHFVVRVMKALDRVLFEHMLSRRSDRAHYLEIFDKYINNWNTCKFKYITVFILATRMSGEMNTSMSNGFANLITTKYVLHKKGIVARTCVEGDDGVTAVPKGTPLDKEDFRKVGFTIKLGRFENLNEASFCGLVYDPKTFDVVADPLKFLLNFFYTRTKYVGGTDMLLKRLLKSKAMSAIVQYPNAPVISSVAQYAYRMCRNVKHKVCLITGDDRYKAMNLARFREIVPRVTEESRELVARLFNFPIDVQLKVEAYFDGKNDFDPWYMDEVYELCNTDSKIYFDTYGNYYRSRADSYPGALWPRMYPIEHTVAVNIKFDGKQRLYQTQAKQAQEEPKGQTRTETCHSESRLRAAPAKI